MPATQPYLPRPGMSEQEIAAEMISDSKSDHWPQCLEFVSYQVHSKARNFSRSSQEDITQEVMCKVIRYLPHFRFDSSFSTWLHTIIGSCIVDESRRRRQEPPHIPLEDTFVDEDHSSDVLQTIATDLPSVEEDFEQKERMSEWVAALLEYANTHRNPIRNRQIIRMVLFEGRTQEEAARTAGCHPGIVSYVIHQAQAYARHKLNHQP